MSVGEKQGHLADLHTKSKVELLELIKRQEKLVANVWVLLTLVGWIEMNYW